MRIPALLGWLSTPLLAAPLRAALLRAALLRAARLATPTLAAVLLAVPFAAAPLLAGCGGGDEKDTASDPAGSNPDGAGAENAGGDDTEEGAQQGRQQSVVLLTLRNAPDVLTGGAQLNVRELNPLVRLVVTTVFESNSDNLLELELHMNGVENAMGVHTESLSSSSDAPAFVIAYIDRISYSSQSGTLDVTLTNDGNIEGNFEAQLLPDGVPAGSVQPLSISGQFAGSWSLVCRSPVLILPGDHSTADSPYCRALTF